MDIRRLRAFRTIVEAGGLTKAAGLLHVTPGALSKSMRQLENEVGKTLFAKDGRSIRLTDHGKLLYHASASLMDEHGRVLRALDSSRDDQARLLRLATYEVFSTHFLGALLDEGLAGRPCQVLELQVGALEQAIADNRADVGITYAPIAKQGLTFRHIADADFQIFVKRGSFANVPFADLPFAIPVTKIDEVLSDILGIDCWPYERVSRRVTYRLTSLESALALCRRGLCAVFLPSFLVPIHNESNLRANRLVPVQGPHKLGRVTRRVHVVHRDVDRGNETIEAVVTATKTMLESSTV